MSAKDPLGDGISSVALLEVMGSDLSVVNAARVSMNKESPELSQQDARLIHYLSKHGHWTPFSHPQISLRIKMPMFIARQWFKHQIGFSRNEVSRRYVSDTPEIYIAAEWRKKADNVKQGSSDEVIDFPWHKHAKEVLVSSLILYDRMIALGVCPEQARMVLPQSTYTEFIETGSLAAYARLAKLRLDPHAQREVRLYAEAVSLIIEPLFPASWEALTK